jgi:hypothetical protein
VKWPLGSPGQVVRAQSCAVRRGVVRSYRVDQKERLRSQSSSLALVRRVLVQQAGLSLSAAGRYDRIGLASNRFRLAAEKLPGVRRV